MNQGGFLTRQCLIAPIANVGLELDATIFPEHTVKLAQTVGFIDLRIDLGPLRIAVEAELNPNFRHLQNDLCKALALPAHLLLVDVPNWQTCRTGRKAMARLLEQSRKNGLPADLEPAILILPVGPAIQQLRQLKDLVTRSLSDGSQNHKIMLANLKQALADSKSERSKL
jgi:hypothetical protein